MRNMQSTFDLTSFKNLDAPKYGGYHIFNDSLPKGNEIFGKTFYAILGGTIYALKILAWALNGGSVTSRAMFLVQTPKFTKWLYLDSYPLFTSVNDLIEGKNRYEIPVECAYKVFDNIPTSVRMEHKSYHWEIMQSFYFSKTEGVVRDKSTKIAYFVATPQGIFFGLEQEDNCYNTKEECLSAKFNGMDIVDFAEPTIIDIKIEIQPTKPIVRTLTLK